MAFTVQDFQDLLALLRQRPDWQAELRMVLLSEELLHLPALVRELVEAQRRAEERLSGVEERLGRLEEAVAALAEAQRHAEERLRRAEERLSGVEERLGRLEEAVAALAEAQRHAEERLRRAEERLSGVEERLGRLEEAVAALAEAQRHAEERLRRAEERLSGVEERLGRLEEAVAALADAQRRTEAEVRTLAATLKELDRWRRGEQGRREGEAFERRTALRAFKVLGAGWGGSPAEDAAVRAWVDGLLRQLVVPPEDDADPGLADVVWRKDGVVGVVEVSVAVDRWDVERAARRAQTLREVGMEAVPLVVGQRWGRAGAAKLAVQLGVGWRVGEEVSEEFRQFRARPAVASA